MREEFTVEQTMDKVLTELCKEYRTDYGNLQNNMGGKYFAISHLPEILITLIADGYVAEEPNHSQGTNSYYSITNNGKRFIRDGGYVIRKEREEDAHRNSIKVLSITKQTLFWSIVAVILSAIAIGISLFK